MKPVPRRGIPAAASCCHLDASNFCAIYVARVKTATAHPPPRGPRARQNNNNNISVEIGRRTVDIAGEVFWLPQEVDKGGRVEADLQKVDKLEETKPVDKVEDYGRPR